MGLMYKDIIKTAVMAISNELSYLMFTERTKLACLRLDVVTKTPLKSPESSFSHETSIEKDAESINHCISNLHCHTNSLTGCRGL